MSETVPEDPTAGVPPATPPEPLPEPVPPPAPDPVQQAIDEREERRQATIAAEAARQAELDAIREAGRLEQERDLAQFELADQLGIFAVAARLKLALGVAPFLIFDDERAAETRLILTIFAVERVDLARLFFARLFLADQT